MSDWRHIQTLAWEYHASAQSRSGGYVHSTSLLDAAEALTNIRRVSVPSGSPLLDGGDAQLDGEIGTIFFSSDVDADLIPYYQAHEYAHYWLGHGAQSCGADELDPAATVEPIPFGAQRVEGYSPKEQRERAANIFAREFLLPAPLARQWFTDEGLTASSIANRTGLPEGIVLHQLTRALLISSITDESQRLSTDGQANSYQSHELHLDQSQSEAAAVVNGPVFVEAGPGTGKTRTLVGRIRVLLERGVPPNTIIALTFSNKAAAEMRQRIAQIAPDAAPHIWMGTFHAFGLELLRKFGTRIGLPEDPHVLDPLDAVMLLERELLALELDHYQDLYDPAVHLRDILNAISRAKDELVNSEQYAALARSMAARATTPEEHAAAAKAHEVARVYAFYQRRLVERGWVDFGDLVAQSVQLLREQADVRRHIQQAYTHILVDEYQDVNHASGRLLQEIAGAGTGLWVVGDVRQAIYRFRGAAPSNVQRFGTDFPGAQRLTLQRNYRSRPAILKVVAGFAQHMKASAGPGFTTWDVDRSDDAGTVLMHVAEDREAEILGIANEIKFRKDQGIPFQDQAVLCRWHTTLARVATGLEQLGVPTLYLGDLFERSEIRDLLALLDFACTGDGRGLVRIARFDEYQIPLADVLALLDLARQLDVPFPRALSLAQDADSVSPAGQQGFARLREHLDGLCYGTSAWGLLTRYLFERSRYLHGALTDTSAAGFQARIAIFQFLQFAYDRRDDAGQDGGDSKRAFLRFVRQLVIHNEDRDLRQVPDWAADVDAVRLLTIHASKGLEFGAVYLPELGGRYFPAPLRNQPCPPPIGLIADASGNDNNEEEECLFFVALSRARDVLSLSRAERYGVQRSNPSKFLQTIASLLPTPPDGPVTWLGVVPDSPLPPPDPDQSPATGPPLFDVRDLDIYINCPRRYFYESVLHLGSRREDAAYVQFHRCVYRVLAWLADQQRTGHVPDQQATIAALDGFWLQHGPLDHPYERLYRERAELLVTRAMLRVSDPSRYLFSPVWEVPRPGGRIQLRPDQIEFTAGPDGTKPVVRRLRTGRPSTSDSDDNIYALYQVAALAEYPGSDVEVLYLSTDERRVVHLKVGALQTRLKRYDAAIAGIGASEFPARPSSRYCPRCPHYFICPLAEDS